MNEGRAARPCRIIAVSNRVATPGEGDKAAGGLAVGVLSALRSNGGIWFGWNGKLTPAETHRPEVEEHGNIRFVGIDLNESDYEGYYNGFSNRVLWPLFHYLLNFIQYRHSDFDAYLRVNATFARKLLPLIEDDDIIWVHDYHLIPLASELRKAGVVVPIGFFLHVPFPGFDVLQALPDRNYLLRSMCAYDVVGFHIGEPGRRGEGERQLVRIEQPGDGLVDLVLAQIIAQRQDVAVGLPGAFEVRQSALDHHEDGPDRHDAHERQDELVDQGGRFPNFNETEFHICFLF